MAKYARIENDIAIEVINGAPAGKYHPDVAALFVQVPAAVRIGSKRSGDNWTAPAEVEVVERRLLQLSPPAYLLLFTPQERIAIRLKAKEENEAGAVVADFLSLVDDPRLTAVDLTLPAVQMGHAFLVSLGLLTVQRKSEIEQGVAL